MGNWSYFTLLITVFLGPPCMSTKNNLRVLSLVPKTLTIGRDHRGRGKRRFGTEKDGCCIYGLIQFLGTLSCWGSPFDGTRVLCGFRQKNGFPFSKAATSLWFGSWSITVHNWFDASMVTLSEFWSSGFQPTFIQFHLLGSADHPTGFLRNEKTMVVNTQPLIHWGLMSSIGDQTGEMLGHRWWISLKNEPTKKRKECQVWPGVIPTTMGTHNLHL